MRRVQAGPGTNNYKPKQDVGKTLPAGNTTGAGFRPTAVAVRAYTMPRRSRDTDLIASQTGPNASGTEYTATLDPGKQLPAGDNKY